MNKAWSWWIRRVHPKLPESSSQLQKLRMVISWSIIFVDLNSELLLHLSLGVWRNKIKKTWNTLVTPRNPNETQASRAFPEAQMVPADVGGLATPRNWRMIKVHVLHLPAWRCHDDIMYVAFFIFEGLVSNDTFFFLPLWVDLSHLLQVWNLYWLFHSRNSHL